MTDLAKLNNYLIYPQNVKCYILKLNDFKNRYLRFICTNWDNIKIYLDNELILECSKELTKNINDTSWFINIIKHSNNTYNHIYICDLNNSQKIIDEQFIKCLDIEYSNFPETFYTALLTNLWSIMGNANNEWQNILQNPNWATSATYCAFTRNILLDRCLSNEDNTDNKLVGTNNKIYQTGDNPNLYVQIANALTKVNNGLTTYVINHQYVQNTPLNIINKLSNIICFDVLFDEVASKWVYGVLIKDKEGKFIFKTLFIEDFITIKPDDTINVRTEVLLESLSKIINRDLHPEYNLELTDQSILNFFVKDCLQSTAWFKNLSLGAIKRNIIEINNSLIFYYSRFYNLKNKLLNKAWTSNDHEHITDLDGENLTTIQFYNKYINYFDPTNKKTISTTPKPKTRL